MHVRTHSLSYHASMVPTIVKVAKSCNHQPLAFCLITVNRSCKTIHDGICPLYIMHVARNSSSAECTNCPSLSSCTNNDDYDNWGTA